MHGEDAFLAAKEVFHTNSVVKYIGVGKMHMCTKYVLLFQDTSLILDMLLRTCKQYMRRDRSTSNCMTLFLCGLFCSA